MILNIVLTAVILLILIWILYKAYRPNIEIIIIERGYKVFFWYNSYKETRINRKFIKLYEYKRKMKNDKRRNTRGDT